MINKTVESVRNRVVALGLTTAISLATFSGQSATLLNETFNNGTPGTVPAANLRWHRRMVWATRHLWRSVANPNYYMFFDTLSFSVLDYPVGSSTGVNNITNYSIKFGTLKLGGDATTSTTATS
jgi:hypothetical protein